MEALGEALGPWLAGTVRRSPNYLHRKCPGVWRWVWLQGGQRAGVEVSGGSPHSQTGQAGPRLIVISTATRERSCPVLCSRIFKTTLGHVKGKIKQRGVLNDTPRERRFQ